jgi:hypothetical protein
MANKPDNQNIEKVEKAEKVESKNGDLIRVETTGNFGLIDPVTNLDISHEGVTETVRTPFIERMLNIKRLKEV